MSATVIFVYSTVQKEGLIMKQPRELRKAVYVGLGIYLYPALPKNDWVKLVPKSRTLQRAPFSQYIKLHLEGHSLCVTAVLARDTRIFQSYFEMNNELKSFRHLYVWLIIYFQCSLSSPGNTLSVSKCIRRPHPEQIYLSTNDTKL
jgi:hypothetical protein